MGVYFPRKMLLQSKEICWFFSLIFIVSTNGRKSIHAANITLFPSVQTGALISQVRASGLIAYHIKTIHSHLSNKLYMNSNLSSNSSMNENIVKVQPAYLPLSINSRRGYVTTTKTFIAIPGDVLTVTVSVMDRRDLHEKHEILFVVRISCYLNSTKRLFQHPQVGLKCLNRTAHILETDEFFPGTSQQISEMWMLRSEVFFLEIDSAKFSSLLNQSDSVMVKLVTHHTTKVFFVFSVNSKHQERYFRLPIDASLRTKSKSLSIEISTFRKKSSKFRASSLASGIRMNMPGSNFLGHRLEFLEGSLTVVLLSRSRLCETNQCVLQPASSFSIKEDEMKCFAPRNWYKDCSVTLGNQSKKKDTSAGKPGDGNDVSRVKFVFIAKPGYNNTGTDVLSNSQKIVNIVISTIQEILNPRKIKASEIKSTNKRFAQEYDVRMHGFNSSGKLLICEKLEIIKSRLREMLVANVAAWSFDCCENATEYLPNNKGTINWPRSLVNATVMQTCPKVKGGHEFQTRKVLRKCELDSTNGAQWQKSNMRMCIQRDTASVQELANKTVTAENVAEFSGQLANATRSLANKKSDVAVTSTTRSIENIVHTGKAVDKEVAENVLTATSNLLDIDQEVLSFAQAQSSSSQRILKAMQTMADTMTFNGSKININRKNIVLTILIVDAVKSQGISIGTRNDKSFNDNASSNATSGKNPSGETSIFIPAQAVRLASTISNSSKLRFTSFVYENSKLFADSLSQNVVRDPIKNDEIARSPHRNKAMKSESRKSHGSEGSASSREDLTIAKKSDASSSKELTVEVVNSKIVSAALSGIKLRNLSSSEEIVLGFMPQPYSNTTWKSKCVFWDFDAKGGSGSWSTEGCRMVENGSGRYRCRCNHMTHFGVLLQVPAGKAELSERQRHSLSMVTYIGCGISFVCLLLTFTTFAVFRKLRQKQPPQIMMLLCLSLMLTLITFVVGIQTKERTSCKIFGALIHFFVLASFGWMGVEGVVLYLFLAKVLKSTISKLILKSNVFAWGVPLIIVAVTAGVSKMDVYGKMSDGKWICIVSGLAFYLSYLLPMLLTMAVNLVILALVSKSLTRKSAAARTNQMSNVTKIRIFVACSTLMGTTWIIGLFAINVLTFPFQVIFCVLNSLQGFFIFVFYCVRSPEVRKEWMKCFGKDDERRSSTGAVMYRTQTMDSTGVILGTSRNHNGKI